MKKENIKKICVAGIALIFLISAFVPAVSSMRINLFSIRHIEKQIKSKIDLDTMDDPEPIDDNWNVTLEFNEPGSAYDNAFFGEKSDASDGQDGYDVPKSPPGFPPYIRAWFDTDFTDPYDELWEEYKKYPDSYKDWNLTVQWVPSDYTSPTTITVSWDNTNLSNSGYNSVILYDVNNNENVSNMISNSSYSFTCPALTPQNFKIICTTNLPPNANDDTDTVAEDSTNNQINVLLNDNDPEGDDMNITDVTQPIHGAVTYNVDYVFYTPDSDYNGMDFFTYTIHDGEGGTDTATVNVTITPVNDAPVANDDYYTTEEDTTLNVPAPGILANDTDLENDTLSATLISDVSHGDLSFNADGSFIYDPDNDYVGTDSFTYRAFDGIAVSNIATVHITVTNANDPPVAYDDYYSTNEDTTLNVAAPGVLSNDTDPESDPLTASLVSDVTHGTLSLNSNGGFQYIPDSNYFGSDTFTYQAYDGNEYSNEATVTITIDSVNDPPVANDDDYETEEDTPLIVQAPGILTNDTDPENDLLSAVLFDGVTKGTLTFYSNGSFIYTPNSNYYGSDSFTYKAYDGAIVSNTATVYLTITQVNDPPVANDDDYSVNEDTTLTVSAPGVLLNDTDIEDDDLTAVLITDVSHGTLSLSSNGGFIYSPDDDYSGTDTFTYQAYDGNSYSNTATVTITIIGTNDPPVANDDYYTTEEDTTLIIPEPGILANDTDLENDPLSSVLVGGVSHGNLIFYGNGSFKYTPSDGFVGSDSFTYRAFDGIVVSNIATVYLTITPVNDPPVANDDDYSVNEDTTLNVATPGVLANDTDPENDDLTADLVDDVSHGTLSLNSDGSFDYTPEAEYFGTDTFTYRAYDGLEYSNTATVTIIIDPVNDPPSIPSNPNPADGATDVSTYAILSWTGGDPEGDNVTYDVYLGDISPPPKVSSNQTTNSYNPPGELQNDTTFYWQIISWDEHGASTDGAIWSFTTEPEPNQPPYEPSNPVPNNESTDVSISTDLSWSGGDPENDNVTYDVYFGITSPPQKVNSNQSGNSYNPGTLEFDTTYYWQIIAWDEYGLKTNGPIWNFVTRDNNPPNNPRNPDPENGEIDVSIFTILSWAGGDPDGDSVEYDVYFGTSISPPKVVSNQSGTSYNPGDLQMGTKYYWKIVSWDEYDYTTKGPLWNFTTRTNAPPYKPSNPIPTNNSENVSIYADLKWDGGDPDGDMVNYEIFFGTTSPPPRIADNYSSTVYEPGDMNFTTRYYWKIISYDEFNTKNEGPIWTFLSELEHNREPTRPTITGPQVIHVPNKDYDYEISTTDPDDDNVFYYIDWGDGTFEDWNGPYSSGQNFTMTHSWPPATKLYEIQVKAKDIYGAESDWGKMYVFVLKNRAASTNSLMIRFIMRSIERFPIFERIFTSGPFYNLLIKFAYIH
jgi:VCBS repeat-containing protein